MQFVSVAVHEMVSITIVDKNFVFDVEIQIRYIFSSKLIGSLLMYNL